MAETPSGVLRVEVVAADRIVWEGNASSVIVRTTEGDLGILANHEPLLAILVPCAAEVLSTDGPREIIAVDGGFISVANNRVSLLAQYARLAEEISLETAQHEFNQAHQRLEEGDISEENMRHFHRAEAQLRAAEKSGTRH